MQKVAELEEEVFCLKKTLMMGERKSVLLEQKLEK